VKYNFDEIIDRQGTQSAKYQMLPDGTPEGALSLWVADMDFRCAEPIIKALHDRVEHGIFGYSLYKLSEVKSTVVGWYKKRFDWDVEEKNVFFSPGIIPALSALIQLLSKEGDGIIIQPPVYFPFAGKIGVNRRVVANSPLIRVDGDYVMDYETLEEKFADPKNVGMILCSPHNPVGRVWSEDELRRLVEIAKKYDKWILSDEIHFDLVRKGVKHTPLLKICPEYADKVVVCTAPSKTFNLAGMQISNIVIHDPELQEKWLGLVDDCWGMMMPNAMGVTAMMAAYTQGEEWLDQVIAYIDENMKAACAYVKENLPKARMDYPEGTYLLWLDLSEYCGDPEKLAEIMLKKAKVVLDDGYIFGPEGNGFERINVACPRSILMDCLERIKTALVGA